MANWTQDKVQALAAAVAARRDYLGRSQLDAWRRGGPANSTMTSIEKAASRSITSKTLKKLDMGMDWVAGTALGVLRGEIDPHAASRDPRYDQRQIDEAELANDEKLRVTTRTPEPTGLRLLRLRRTPESERSPEDVAWLREWDAAHPRRPDPALGVDEDGNWLPVETTFENWLQTRNQLSTRVLHYARARGISFKAAEEELPHVQQMAADVANGTGRPWTPPWDPGAEFDEDEEPWKAEFWSYTEAVPSPYGTEGYIYRHGLTYDLDEARANRAKSAHAAKVWKEDKAKQAAAYYEREKARAESGEPLVDAELQAWITRSSRSTTNPEPSHLSRMIKSPPGSQGPQDQPINVELTSNGTPPSSSDRDNGGSPHGANSGSAADLQATVDASVAEAVEGKVDDKDHGREKSG